MASNQIKAFINGKKIYPKNIYTYLVEKVLDQLHGYVNNDCLSSPFPDPFHVRSDIFVLQKFNLIKNYFQSNFCI